MPSRRVSWHAGYDHSAEVGRVSPVHIPDSLSQPTPDVAGCLRGEMELYITVSSGGELMLLPSMASHRGVAELQATAAARRTGADHSGVLSSELGHPT